MVIPWPVLRDPTICCHTGEIVCDIVYKFAMDLQSRTKLVSPTHLRAILCYVVLDMVDTFVYLSSPLDYSLVQGKFRDFS